MGRQLISISLALFGLIPQSAMMAQIGSVVLQHPAPQQTEAERQVVSQGPTFEELQKEAEEAIRAGRSKPKAGSAEDAKQDAVRAAQQLLDEARRSDSKDWRGIVGSVQMMLGRFGYGTGPFDGVLDKRTSDALTKYQVNNELKASGVPDAVTMFKLNADNAALEELPVYLQPLLSKLAGFRFRGVENIRLVLVQTVVARAGCCPNYSSP